MNPVIKKQWVIALRSGKYTQGKKFLRPTEKTFCCLGVLCDLNDPWQWDFDSEEQLFYLDSGSLLPEPICAWADISQDPVVHIHDEEIISRVLNSNILMDKDKVKSGAICLSTLNDAGFTFEEIANLIEIYL